MKNVTLLATSILTILARETTGKNKDKTLRTDDIAGETGVSSDYIDQITSKLRKADLVGSIQGCKGGLYFKRLNAECITLAEIYLIFEGHGSKPAEQVAEDLIVDGLRINLNKFNKKVEALKGKQKR